MDKALIKLFEKEMFNKENSEDGFRNFVLDYYKKHSKDTFEYPKDRGGRALFGLGAHQELLNSDKLRMPRICIRESDCE